jgi:hypothetical protein
LPLYEQNLLIALKCSQTRFRKLFPSTIKKLPSQASIVEALNNLNVFSWALRPVAINCPYYFFYNCVQNALKFAYVHLSVQKLSGGYTPDPHFKGTGGKTKGRVALEGMEGRKCGGKMKEKGRGGRRKGEGIV